MQPTADIEKFYCVAIRHLIRDTFPLGIDKCTESLLKFERHINQYP